MFFEMPDYPTSKPLAQKIDCVRLAVPDLESGLAFYRDRLGHALVWRTSQAAGLRLPETDAELVLYTHSEPAEPEIDLQVAAVDLAVARFEAAGGKIIVSPFEIRIGRAAVVADPWDNRLVLLDMSKGLLVTDAGGNVIANAPVKPVEPAGRQSEPSLRLAGPQDFDALCRLYYEFNEFHVQGVPDRLRSLGPPEQQDWTRLQEAFDLIFSSEAAAILLAEVSGSPAGLVEVYLREDSVENDLTIPYRYAHIQSLIVAQQFRKQGLGSLLVEAAQEWAKARAVAEVRLDVWEFDAGPLPFYTRLGYRTLKRTLVKGM